MKKILLGIAVILVVFLIMAYLSFFSGPKEVERGIIVGIDNIDNTDFRNFDSITIAASNRYKGNVLKKLMQGEHYRETWTTPIKVPVVYLDKLHGGLTPTEKGGGKQTRSLELISKDGMLYTLRSINKYPDPLIPKFAKVLKIDNLVEDGISAQHPYASIVVAELAKSVDLESTHPKVMFVPKQDALGEYSDEFGNALYMFEFESEGEKNWTKYDNIEEIIDTEDLQELKLEEKDNLSIDRDILVRARLFDIIIGDWDRHAQQWGWALQRQDGKLKAIPIPADRDNAFFDIDGILPTLISNKIIEPELRPFREDIDYMPGLVKPFDIYFLYDTPAEVFIEQAQFIQNNLTDDVIHNAFKVWPPEIYRLNAPELISKIKARRDKLKEIGLKFREVIQNSELLSEPLKGTDDDDLKDKLIKCFECGIEAE